MSNDVVATVTVRGGTSPDSQDSLRLQLDLWRGRVAWGLAEEHKK